MTTLLNARIIALILISLLVWDFNSFCVRAGNSGQDINTLPSQQHAVVTLTGGRTRILAASELAKNLSLPLFISGVHEDATPDEVAEAAGVDPAFFQCCATLGYKARTTHGNGVEISEWADSQNYSRLIVVTSNYHLERALVELGNAMPNADLTGFAVASPAINPNAWWKSPRSAKRMAQEWFKWRIVKAANAFGLL
jgi:uncharacterized SAM-binding protein YcdF (DUF218 family)